MKRIFGMIPGVLLLAGMLIGLVMVVAVPIEMLKKADAETWPSRKGVITTSYVRSGSAGGIGHKTRMMWRAEVCGNYLEKGESFCVSRIRYGDIRFGKTSSQESVERYRVGREVDVYYSPSDPRETVLEPLTSWKEMFVLLGVGIGFLSLPVILWAVRKTVQTKHLK